MGAGPKPPHVLRLGALRTPIGALCRAMAPQTGYTAAMRIEADRLPDIVSERLKLRWLEASDAPDIFAIFSDAEVTRYWSSPQMTSLEQAQQLIADIQDLFAEHSLYQWGVTERRDDRVIGTLTLASIDRQNRRAELGFALGRSSWGHGYMREAASVALDFAFGEMDLTRIEADVDPNNEPSLRLLDHLGFQREGYLRERWRVGGVVADSVLLGLLRREWRAREAQAEPLTPSS